MKQKIMIERKTKRRKDKNTTVVECRRKTLVAV